MELNFFITATAIVALIASILLGIKALSKKDYTILVMGIADVFLFASLFILKKYNDSFFIYVAILSVVFSQAINAVIWFLSKSYRAELESKNILKTLKVVQDKNLALIENLLVGVYIFDENGKIEYVNKVLAEIVGYKPYELINKNIFDIIYPEDLPMVKENIRRRVSGEIDSISYDIRMISKNNTIINVRVRGFLTRNGHVTISGSLVKLGDKHDLWIPQS